VRDYYTEALATIPDINQLDQAIKRLTDRVNELGKVPHDRILAGRRKLIAEVQAVAASGGDWPQDLAQRAYENVRLVEMEEAEKVVTESALANIKGQRDTAILAGSPAAIRYLVAPLQELLTAARQAVRDLNGAREAQDVLDAGGKAVEAWAQLQSYGDEYAAIRRAQRQLAVNARGGEGDRKPTVELGDLSFNGLKRVHLDEVLERGGEMRNYNQVNPGWVEQVRANGEVTKAFRRPDNRQHLIDLLDSPADIWMPTLRQATEAYVEQRKAVQEQRRAHLEKHTAGNWAPEETPPGMIRAHQIDSATRDRKNFMSMYAKD
jgi:hypothetical protein